MTTPTMRLILAATLIVLTGCDQFDGEPPAGRYAISSSASEGILLDTATGATWHLHKHADGSLSWEWVVRVPGSATGKTAREMTDNELRESLGMPPMSK